MYPGRTVNVAGTTVSPDYPVVFGRPRRLNDPQDAVRTVLDLLPASVGRTDATGPLPPALGIFGPAPGTDGGTTPPCALLPFGNQLGLAAPPLQRMLIDYEGVPPGPGAVGNIVVTRPPTSLTGLVAVLQFAFPGAPGTFLPITVPSGIEIWTFLPGSITQPYSPVANAAFRSDPLAFPPAPFTCTVQVFYGVFPDVPAGNPLAGIPCQPGNPGFSSPFAASPGLFLTY